jgi:AcrR family transcriptional regulator
VGQHSSRREVLLDRLIDLFLAEGFARFSVEDLAARLKCSKSTLYALSPSKEQLITMVVRSFFRRSTERVEHALSLEQDPEGRIRTYLDGIANELAPATGTFYIDLDRFEPTRAIYSRNVETAALQVQKLVAAAVPPNRPADATFVGASAALVMAAIQQGRVRAMTGVDDADAYRALADLIVAGLAGGPIERRSAGPDDRNRR